MYGEMSHLIIYPKIASEQARLTFELLTMNSKKEWCFLLKSIAGSISLNLSNFETV